MSHKKHKRYSLQSLRVVSEATVGAALCGRPLLKIQGFPVKRAATEGRPYSCALEKLTFEASSNEHQSTRNLHLPALVASRRS